VASISARGARRRASLAVVLIASAFAAILWSATTAGAAELLYWDNYGANPDNVAFANIDGSGGGALNIGSEKVESPEGMAYDTLTNRLFVASEGTSDQILAISLDGSGAAPFTAPGAPINEPEGVAVDPATRTIYWLNTGGGGSVAWAKLDGSAGGTLDTTGAALNLPCCRLAIDPVGGRAYWPNNGGTIGFTSLDNSGGGGSLNLTGSTVTPGGEGLAVDSAAGRLYFLGGNEIGYANLNGSGGGNVALGGGVINLPWGLGFDPSIGRLYWGNESNGTNRENAIGFTGLSSPGGGISIATAPVASPQDPVIIKSPTGTEAPAVTRSAKSRSSLSCSTGGWAGDFAGSFVYQAPRTFAYQWTRNGAAITGATAASFEAKSAGKYACAVTATNQAGSASQTSAAANVKAAKMKLTAKKATAKAGGVAKLKVKAVNQGDLQSKSAKVCAKVPAGAKADLKATKCASLGKLKGHGKRSATLKLKVAPSADGTYTLTFVVKGAPGRAARAKLLVH
jgi:DNA-binding beta-propeller fold protein YncE